MIDENILLSNVTRICVGEMFDKAAMVLPTVLECQTPGCTCGHGGAWWSTPPRSEDVAMEMMDIHRAAHGQQIGGGGGDVCVGGGDEAVNDTGWSWPSSSLQEIPRPMIQEGCSQEDYNFFKREWLR